jgi:lipoprotein-anchoring transpeptidase ErfK/SrfK
MAGEIAAMMKGKGVKLLLAAALIGVAVQVTGLPTRETAERVVPAPVRAKVAAPISTTIAAPAAAPEPILAPADEPFVIKRILDVPKPFEHGDYVWDDAGVPAGPLVVTIDLAAQTLSVFRGGYEIGAAVILYGADEKPTPLGVFPITQKDADHVSNLYDAPMPYMLRLTNDGISIHGSEVGWNYATHGCIGVPVKFAKLLFGQARLGDKVIVTNGERLDMGQRIPAA